RGLTGANVTCPEPAARQFPPHSRHDPVPGTIMATTACFPGMPETITLIFERMTIRIDGLQAQVFHHDGQVETLGGEGTSGSAADPMAFDHTSHRNLISAFLDTLEGKAPLAVDLTDLLKTRELIHAMTEDHGH
ncbi:hypothetical protein OU682_22420, partial [Paracoccus sp. EF6]|nr:hypothetical protein [Paracoccus sp. EF6]